MRIVTAMRNTAFWLAIFVVSAAPAMAQIQQVGFLLGGSKRLISSTDQAEGIGVSDNFSFSNSNRELYYGVQLDPGTWFKVRVGQIEGPVAFAYKAAGGSKARTDIKDGQVEHVDSVIDYRFSEPFGTTGLFAGLGYYRQQGTITDPAVPAEQHGRVSETNYGFLGGVNTDFPITKRTGFIAELTYHWINMDYKVRYLTLSGGLRFSF